MRTNLRRRMAGWVAVLFVLGQISALAHGAFTQHRICPRHGEVVHQDPSVAASLPSAHGWAGDAEERRDVAGHNHGCVFLASARSLVGTASQVRMLSVPESQVADRSVVARPVLRTVDLILLAPKQSPPRA
ncbi:MAG: hypothetical protein HYT87_08780 [Nitrospirae bacterium]|nr:hypothetical protein [Nitrospirota bacterium]